MSASSLEAARNALSQLLSLTDEEGSPTGPTSEGDLNGELSALPTSSTKAAIRNVYNRIRTALGLEEMPEGSVSFFKRLKDGEEEYHLRYNLSPAGKTGREERIIGQVDVGKVFILTRRLPAEGDGNESTSDDLGRLTAEIDQSRELESGAKITTETTWENGQLGPVELGAVEAYFVPAVDLLEREDE